MQSQPNTRPLATDSSLVPIGIDDGYAVTKLALADGRLLAIPSAARVGRSNVSWMPRAEQLIFEYETEGTVFSVGDVDASSTRFEGYSSSALNRVIVQHALQCADLEGRELAAVSGLPVSHFYHRSGKRRATAITEKQANLTAPVTPRSAASAAEIIDHDVVPEALAAWYDHVITVNDGRASLDQERICRPLAVVDIGGRTTDTVVVANQGIEHSSSASVTLGCLDVQRSLANSLEERFELAGLGHRQLRGVLETGRIRLYGRDYDVSAEIDAARAELSARLHTEIKRQLGRGAELERIVIVGGGALALRKLIADWFPNQVTAPQPAFANARGMLKYRRFVLSDDAAERV